MVLIKLKLSNYNVGTAMLHLSIINWTCSKWLYSNNIHIAFITETWWTTSSLKAIKGYSTFYKNREICKVCKFINNISIKVFEVVDIVYKGVHGNHIWCSIQFGKENILCACIYRPPLSVRVDRDTEILAALTSASKSQYDGILICGDFNHPSLSWTDEGWPYTNVPSPGDIISKLYCDVILHLLDIALGIY